MTTKRFRENALQGDEPSSLINAEHFAVLLCALEWGFDSAWVNRTDPNGVGVANLPRAEHEEFLRTLPEAARSGYEWKELERERRSELFESPANLAASSREVALIKKWAPLVMKHEARNKLNQRQRDELVLMSKVAGSSVKVGPLVADAVEVSDELELDQAWQQYMISAGDALYRGDMETAHRYYVLSESMQNGFGYTPDMMGGFNNKLIDKHDARLVIGVSAWKHLEKNFRVLIDSGKTLSAAVASNIGGNWPVHLNIASPTVQQFKQSVLENVWLRKEQSVREWNGGHVRLMALVDPYQTAMVDAKYDTSGF